MSCAIVVFVYPIGAFAQLGGVSARMLRHYDHIGLLMPADVDPATGRRLYAADQLSRLNRLVALKHLGFSLAQVRTLLDDGIDAAELRGMLRMRAADLQTRLLRDGQTLDRVRARLRLIESETAMTTDVEVKTVAPQRVLALHQVLDQELDPDQLDVEALFERVIERMDAASADRASPISWLSGPGRAGVRQAVGSVPVSIMLRPKVSRSTTAARRRIRCSWLPLFGGEGATSESIAELRPRHCNRQSDK